MSFRPNVTGPSTSMGRITVAAAGTSVLLNDNWDPKYDSSRVTSAAPQQYAVACEDIIINPNPDNAGNLYIVTRGGSKDDPDTILYIIVKGQSPTPVHFSQILGGNRFAPEAYALDADQNGDWANVSGTIA